MAARPRERGSTSAFTCPTIIFGIERLRLACHTFHLLTTADIILPGGIDGGVPFCDTGNRRRGGSQTQRINQERECARTLMKPPGMLEPASLTERSMCGTVYHSLPTPSKNSSPPAPNHPQPPPGSGPRGRVSKHRRKVQQRNPGSISTSAKIMASISISSCSATWPGVQ